MRPTEPLPFKPAGYLQMESYSSLKRFWTYLEFAERAGRRLVVTRGDKDVTCRRRIEGYTLARAGGLVDVDRASAELDDGMAAHPALLALAGGDPAPLAAVLDETYVLRVNLTLALTRSRDLILKPDLTYVPLEQDVLHVRLVPRRFGRDELRFMLERACGLA